MARAMTGRARGVVFGLAALVLAAQVALFHGVRLDDAYITFRYAQNLATGAGFVFNPGERVMGSTSPGEVLASAVAHVVYGHDAMPGVMAALGCVGWTVQAIALFYLLVPRFGAFRAGLVALGIGVGAAGSAQWVPLETNVALAATLVAMTLGAQSRWIGAAAACAFAGLMRPDAYLAAGLLAGACLHERRASAWKPAATLIALAAPWPVFAKVYFGSLLPQSAVMKHQQVTHLAYARHVLVDVPGEVAILAAPLAGQILFWALAIAGGAIAVRSRTRLWMLPAYGALHAVAYVTLAPDVAFQWHLYPLTAVAVALALLAVGTALERVALPPRLALGAACVALAGAGTVRFAQRYGDEPWFGARQQIYEEVAAYLVAHADPADIVDAEEVGTVAYLTNLRMNDHARLVTPYPGDVFWRLSNGKKTHLRWMLLNGAQLLYGREKQPFFVPYYEGRPMVLFARAGWKIAVVDLRASLP